MASPILLRFQTDAAQLIIAQGCVIEIFVHWRHIASEPRSILELDVRIPLNGERRNHRRRGSDRMLDCLEARAGGLEGYGFRARPSRVRSFTRRRRNAVASRRIANPRSIL